MPDPVLSPTRPNLHPVDRLADIRSQIATLEAEHAEIRQGIIEGDIPLVGNTWKVSITEQSGRIISVKEAERLLPPELFNAIVRAFSSKVLRLKKLQGERD